MAANLNTPADFAKVRNRELLPPSSFQKKTQSRVDTDESLLRELAQATSELLKVKQENDKLREAKHAVIPTGEEIKARIDLHQPFPVVHSTPTSHFEDMINRQAAEIADLKKSLNEAETKYQRECIKWESKVLMTDAQSDHKVAALTSELKTLQERHKEKTGQLQREHQAFLADRDTKVTSLSNQLQAVQQEKTDVVQHLNSMIAAKEQQYTAETAELQQQLQGCKQLLEEQQAQLTQMKTYLSQSEELAKSTKAWQTDKYAMQAKIQVCQEEKAAMESQVSLLNSRLNALDNILSIQEKELSWGQEDTEDGRLLLLTRWREKVYELLLQKKSSELTHQQQEATWKQQICRLEEQLRQMQNEVELLRHSITDTKAQLQLSQGSVRTLQSELTRAQQVALTLDDIQQRDQTSVATLLKFVQSIQTQQLGITEALQEQVQGSLRSFSQRIAYASSRMEVLKSQLSRKEALLKLQVEEQRPERDVPQLADDLNREMGELKKELVVVTQERDCLAAQIQHDSQLLNTKIQAAKTQWEDRVCELETRLAETQSLLELKTQRCVELSEQVEERDAGLSEAQETIESLKTDLAKQQLTTDQALQEQRSADASNYMEQLADLERRLNDARREHTKAVVSMRQMERQATRDKERASQHAQQAEQHYKQQLTKQEDRMRHLQAENNLLMTTLRQEGLIGKFKSQRAAPLGSEVMHGSAGDCHPPGLPVPVPQHSGEPLHSVIDELKSLTAAVMEDNTADDGAT